jgi:hypothetical protein
VIYKSLCATDTDKSDKVFENIWLGEKNLILNHRQFRLAPGDAPLRPDGQHLSNKLLGNI